MEILSIELRGLLNVKTKKRDFSGTTLNCFLELQPPSHVVGKKLVAEEIRAEGVLLKDGRQVCSSARSLLLNPLLPKVSTC